MSEAAPAVVHLGKALDGLAENPLLPVDLIGRMLAYRKGFGEIARRPDLTDEMITEIIASDYHRLLHSLALNRRLPNTFRWMLAEHRDPTVRAALVIGGQGAPAELFERLLGDPDVRVREYMAQSDHVPVQVRVRLAGDPDPRIRATLAQWWTRAPLQVRRILLTDAADEVRAAACSTYFRWLPHPVPPQDLHLMLLNDPCTRAGVVRHLDLDHATALRLAEDPDHKVRREAAAHPQLPAELRDRLAGDPNGSVRLSVFARRDTPEPVRARIYRELTSPRHTVDVEDTDDDDRIVADLESWYAHIEVRSLHLDWVTADPLPHVASPYACFRMSAAMAPSLPPQVVRRLLDDEDSHVRTTMARHAPDLVDEPTAERIDREFRPDKPVLWRPADDFAFSPQTLRRFATDADPRMRCLAARDPDLPCKLALQLAADTQPEVRRSIAGHRNLPSKAQDNLLGDPNEWVVHATAASPWLALKQMQRLLALAGL